MVSPGKKVLIKMTKNGKWDLFSIDGNKLEQGYYFEDQKKWNMEEIS